MKMNEQTLLRFLETEAAAAYHHVSGEISHERERALRAYLREPYGTEQEGRAQVVASDVFDAVEGMLPDLVEVFVSSDKAVVFDPVGPEDEQAAEQVTNACNHVFYKQNNGFLVLDSAAKDALLMKTGGVKWYWDERRVASFTTYRNVSEMQLAAFLATNPGAEVVEKVEGEQDPAQAEMLAMQGMVPETVFERVKIKTVAKKGKVTICPIPADEFHVSRRHNSILLDDCPYVAHVSEKTLSEIRQMGYDVSADDVRAAQAEPTTEDRELRETLRGGRYGWWNDENEQDESQVRGWLREEYVLVDFDGDGIAERRRIMRLGSMVLENEECSHVQMAAWTPYILTHRFDGFSVADLVEDFQRIHTDILRAQLDNLDLANNQETVVLTDAQGNPLADIDDLLNRRPGGILREKAQGAIRPHVERWQGVEAMPMLQQLEGAKERRTGHSPVVPGLDADALNKTATEGSKNANERQKRMKLMARIMAECLVAPMFRGIFKTLSDYCMEKLSFRLNGSFVQYDPQEWRDGYDMSINVGIGSGDKMAQSAYLQQIAQAQFALLGTPLFGRVLTEKNLYDTQARIAENAGFKNPQEFWSDPSQMEPPQPPGPPPELQKEQMRLQAEAQEAQAKRADDAYRFQAEQQLQMEADRNREEWQARQKTLELQQEAQLERMRQAFETEREQMRLGFEQWRAQFDRDTQLMLQRMQSMQPIQPEPMNG